MKKQWLKFYEIKFLYQINYRAQHKAIRFTSDIKSRKHKRFNLEYNLGSHRNKGASRVRNKIKESTFYNCLFYYDRMRFHIEWSMRNFEGAEPKRESPGLWIVEWHSSTHRFAWERNELQRDPRTFVAIIFVTQNFTRCPEQIGVAPLRGLLASWTLVIPRRCLINNCLIFHSVSPSFSLLSSLASPFSFFPSLSI